MQIKAKDLTEEQREEFVLAFYEESEFDDREYSPYPWGCPWLWCENHLLIGSSIEEMAKAFYGENRNDMHFTSYEELEGDN